MTIPEFEALSEAIMLKQIDLDYRNHLQAFLNFSVQAEKKAGKNKTTPVYKNFKKFYNYEARIKEVAKKPQQSRFHGIGKFLKKGV